MRGIEVEGDRKKDEHRMYNTCVVWCHDSLTGRVVSERPYLAMQWECQFCAMGSGACFDSILREKSRCEQQHSPQHLLNVF